MNNIIYQSSALFGLAITTELFLQTLLNLVNWNKFDIVPDSKDKNNFKAYCSEIGIKLRVVIETITIDPIIEESAKLFALQNSSIHLAIFLICINVFEFTTFYINFRTFIDKKLLIKLRILAIIMHCTTGLLHVLGFSIIAILLHIIYNFIATYGKQCIVLYKEIWRRNYI